MTKSKFILITHLLVLQVALSASTTMAGEKKNHVGLEFSLGSHENAGAVDDFKTHRNTVQNDSSLSPRTFDEETNGTYGIAALYERALNKKDRLGLRLGIQSIGIGNLKEHFTATETFLGLPVSGTITRKYSVNGSQRFLSAYYRRLFGEKFGISPIIGAGISHVRVTADVDETDHGSVFVGTGDVFPENFDPQERLVPHALLGVDFLFNTPYKTTMGLGFSGEYLFNAKFDGFRNASEGLFMENGQFVSAPLGSSSGRPFEADLTGFTFNITLKILY